MSSMILTILNGQNTLVFSVHIVSFCQSGPLAKSFDSINREASSRAPKRTFYDPTLVIPMKRSRQGGENVRICSFSEPDRTTKSRVTRNG